ncbi:MAG: hypothetical protein IFJ96_03770 [Acidobacteria bacterium]|nr:hypothetical protein [Candidatus Sulfomarinibacter sp. MAG AM2]
MDPCAKALLDGIIDYAGLFPPARLPMNEAFERFLRHRGEADGWMLARFVCPAARLEELEPLLAQSGPPLFPISISVLGSGGETLEDFLTAIDHDSATITAFSARQTDRAVVDVFEVRLPEAGGAAVAVEKAWRRLTDGGSTPMTPFFEVSLLGDWRPRLPAAAAAVRDTDRSAGEASRAGLKIRCGGLDAAAIPEPMAVAAAIATCRATDVPLKATQGLHHPFRHHDSELDTMVHGFLNLYAASVLAHAHDLPVTRLIEIVAEVEPEAFVIENDRFAWRDLEASSEEVAAARDRLLTTFGSCSFSEPRDDLYHLNIIGDVS